MLNLKTSPVKVVPVDEASSVITPTRNPEYGYVKLQQLVPEYRNQWFRMAKRTAILVGKMTDLIEADFQPDQELEGKIVVHETLVPPDPENDFRHLKKAGTTGVICRVDDQPIYRTTYFTTDLTAEDVFIDHTNSEEIKEAIQREKELQEMFLKAAA